jgi:hypothetical protein
MIEAKRSKLVLNCESSEAKRSKRSYSQKSNLRCEANWFILKFTISKRGEANRFDSDFVFKTTTKKRPFVFFLTKGKIGKGSKVNYRSFAAHS